MSVKLHDKFEGSIVTLPVSQQSLLTRRWICSGDAARPGCLAIPHKFIGERVGEVHLRVRGRRWGRGICGGGGGGGGVVAASGGRRGPGRGRGGR